MKKIYIVATLLIIILGLNQAIASDQLSICTSYCPKRPYAIGNIISRGLQNVSGLNFLATKFAESQIKKHLKKYATGDIAVAIDSFSALDLASGKLKKLDIQAKYIKYKEYYISLVRAESDCNFIHIDYKAKPLALMEPLRIKFKGFLSEEDLNRTIKSSSYQNKISKIKIDGHSIGTLEFKNPKIFIEGQNLKIKADLALPGIVSFSVPVEVKSDLKIENNKITLNNAQINSNGIILDLKLPQSAYDKLNPVLFSLKDLETKGKRVFINKVAVNNNKIDVEGTIWLPKSSNENTISKY